MENGGGDVSVSVNGTGELGSSLNGDSKEHKSSEHRSKEHKSKHKHKSKDKDRDRERSRDHKSSHKDKHRSKEHKSHKSSSKDKDRHSSSSKSDRDKDKHRDKDKDKHRDKDRDKDKHRDKDRHRDKDKHGDGKHKDKHREDKDKHKPAEPKEEPMDDFKVKPEPEPEEESMDTREPSPAASAEEPRSAADDSQDLTDGDDEPAGRLVIKEEEPEQRDDSEDDVPLSKRVKPKVSKSGYESEEDAPLSARKPAKVKRKAADSEDEYDAKPTKKVKKETAKRTPKTETASPTKRKKKEEEEKEVWKWWEEEKVDDGVKWRTLEHKGVLLAPLYEPLPAHVRFYYDGKEMRLSEEAEEIATFYAKMLDHDYTTKEVFNKNFFHDWRKAMTEKEREKISHLKKCDFTKMAAWFKEKSEERKNMSKEEKKALKEQNEAITAEYGFCTLDGHREKIGNFRAEPPGLFRGRGEHPKQGKVKRRIQPEDIIINIGKEAKVPEPPAGHKWKEVRHDNSVTWLASWTENIQGQIKYVMLNAASRLKGEKDWQKYETARRLNKCVDKIRDLYRDDFKSKEMRIRQRAVAMYFIDKLALRAGNEKDEDQADTVGCCSLRVEHIKLEEELNGKQYVVVFDFLGKDSIRYYNEVSVEKRVFKNLQLFMENKEPGDDLFDRLNTSILNKHLNEQMEGLTAKVFRTFNASRTLQEQLDQLTQEDMTVNEKILAYNRANRAVAVLCNHQRAVPKTFDKSMENLMKKIADKKEALEDAEKAYKAAKRASKSGGSVKERALAEQKRKAVERTREQLNKLELSATDKEENKEIALGTSKLNYLDPRISVAWCKKWDVPIEKVYNKTQRDKFRWAIDMAGPDFVF